MQLRRTFAHYLADEVIDELLSDPTSLSLGGAERELSILFSDIRDFTSLSEKRSPEELVAFLNAYLTPVTTDVLAHGGLLDKYIGDAVLALFGAPVPREDHPDRALACAVDMHASVAALRASGAADLSIGVGLNSGSAVVGNMGSAERFDYTVVGDAVNLASRLEGLTKKYGVFCLVGEQTRAQASDRYRFRELDLVRVKGREQPVAIFELLGDERRDLASYAALDEFAAGLAAWREGRFDDARARFEAFAGDNPDDGAAQLFLQRLARTPTPPDGWDGVFAFDEK
jgi:adenylate cyclase